MSMYKGHRTSAGRVFDHVYDPLYATSGVRDTWRNNVRSLAISAQVQIYPVFKTMFTDLPYRPRNYFIRLRNPLPFVNAVDANSMQRRLGTAVSGPDRAKFFNTPVGNTKTINLHLDVKPDCGCLPPRPGPIDLTQPPFKTVAMQTVYREQSAQTAAWMPPAIIGASEKETPEIVYVAEMLKDEDPPIMPGIIEAELVARTRKRREWLQSLPAIASQDEWTRRRLVLAAFEWEEWMGREKKIEYCQRLRLGLVQKLMEDRKRLKKQNCATSVALKTSQLEKLKEHKLEQLRSKYRRRIKRYSMEHKGIQKKYLPTDVITEHIDPASNLYAPQSRFGVHPKHRHFMAHKTNYQARLDGLHDNSKAFNCKPFLEKRPDMSLPKPPLKEVERNLYNDKALRELYESLLSLRAMKSGTRKMAKCVQILPPSSEIHISHSNESQVDSTQEELDQQLTIYMQQMIKGRAIQNQIFTGRNNFRELIAEFRTTHQLPEILQMNAQQDKPNQFTEDRKFAHYQQMQLMSILSTHGQVLDLADQANGTTMSFALDLLEKEMVRLNDQKKAHALCILAEHERYCREATEAAYRLRGDNRRRLHDEVSRNVQLSKHNTIASYLEDVLVESMSQMADQEARLKIRDVVRQIDLEAEDPTPIRVVTGILNRFILPDVFRHIARDNYLADVNQTLFGGDGVIPDKLAELKQLQMNRFLQRSVTPRTYDDDVESTLSSLDSNEDPAHHEAMHCIEKAIKRAVNQCEVFGETRAGDLLDDIVRMAIPDASANDESARSQKSHQQLMDITQDLKETLWEYAEPDPKENEPRQHESAEKILQVTEMVVPHESLVEIYQETGVDPDADKPVGCEAD